MHNSMFRPKEAMKRSILRQSRLPSPTSSLSSTSANSSSGNSRSNRNRNSRRNATNSPRPPRQPAQLSPCAQSKLELLPKIAAFRHKGWITAEEEKDFIGILSEHRSNPFDGTVESVERLLNDIQQQQHKKERNRTTTAPPASASLGRVLEPFDLPVMDDTYLQELFCEMCFFARLGFVQPPSCLQCVYQESIQGIQSNSHQCERLVVWRKNARALLHPQQMQDNIVLVQCKAVRSLLEGKTVDAHQWDKKRRQLLYHM